MITHPKVQQSLKNRIQTAITINVLKLGEVHSSRLLWKIKSRMSGLILPFRTSNT